MITSAQAYYNKRKFLSEHQDRILALSRAIDHQTDLSPYQWAQLIAFALEFGPDLILELGRGQGNSTCAFTQAANWLKPDNCRVLSLCLSDAWERETVPAIRKIVPDLWFEPLQALQADILTFDYKSAFTDAQKILVFWDAHGFDIAECVLGNILPLISTLPHYVIMHDLSDARYLPPKSNLYGNNGLWKGNSWEGPRLQIGHIDSAVEQSISILDFTTRNKLTLHSADHSLHKELGSNSDSVEEMKDILDDSLFSLNAHWFYFSLNERPGPYNFPCFHPPAHRKFCLVNRVKLAIKVLLKDYPQ